MNTSLPSESSAPGEKPEAVIAEEMYSLLCSVADNLGDMPVSDAWAEKTSDRARALLATLEPHIITAEWEHAQRHIDRLAERQRSEARAEPHMTFVVEEVLAMYDRRHENADLALGLLRSGLQERLRRDAEWSPLPASGLFPERSVG